MVDNAYVGEADAVNKCIADVDELLSHRVTSMPKLNIVALDEGAVPGLLYAGHNVLKLSSYCGGYANGVFMENFLRSVIAESDWVDCLFGNVSYMSDSSIANCWLNWPEIIADCVSQRGDDSVKHYTDIDDIPVLWDDLFCLFDGMKKHWNI